MRLTHPHGTGYVQAAGRRPLGLCENHTPPPRMPLPVAAAAPPPFQKGAASVQTWADPLPAWPRAPRRRPSPARPSPIWAQVATAQTPLPRRSAVPVVDAEFESACPSRSLPREFPTSSLPRLQGAAAGGSMVRHGKRVAPWGAVARTGGERMTRMDGSRPLGASTPLDDRETPTVDCETARALRRARGRLAQHSSRRRKYSPSIRFGTLLPRTRRCRFAAAATRGSRSTRPGFVGVRQHVCGANLPLGLPQPWGGAYDFVDGCMSLDGAHDGRQAVEHARPPDLLERSELRALLHLDGQAVVGPQPHKRGEVDAAQLAHAKPGHCSLQLVLETRHAEQRHRPDKVLDADGGGVVHVEQLKDVEQLDRLLGAQLLALLSGLPRRACHGVALPRLLAQHLRTE
eukprot:scaffold8581_cov109-Isochrysis_galbana.AAC.7